MSWDGIFEEPITIKEFETIINTEGIFVIVFYSGNCGHCRKLRPILQELSTEYIDKIKFYQVNGKTCANFEEHCNIKMYPTVCIYKNKELDSRAEGLISKEHLKNIFDEVSHGNTT